MTTQELNQTFDKFLTDWNNKQIEAVDPTSPFQCFDLVVKWCDYLKIPRQSGGSIFPFWGASQIYTDFGALQAKYFDRIPNTPDAIPQKGDILVWRWDFPYTGGAGHTAVDTGGSALYALKAFSQNNPSYRRSVVASFPYAYVLGWLRFKTSGTIPLTDTQKVNAITVEMQSGNSDGDKVSHTKKILGLA